MIVMPANSTGRFWDPLARETQLLGHLLSPKGKASPRPWFPYSLDNGAYSCWDKKHNQWSEVAWRDMELLWYGLLDWARTNNQKPIWAIVPDVVGQCAATIERYARYAPQMADFTLAVAVQDGMTPQDVRGLNPIPSVICVGGTTDWKRDTWKIWASEFPRVHVLRVNSPTWIYELDAAGIESCDGTGWNMGDKTQTKGLEAYCREFGHPTTQDLWPYVCSEKRKGSKQKSLF